MVRRLRLRERALQEARVLHDRRDGAVPSMETLGVLKYRTFRGSFSAVSKPNFANEYSFESF